MLMQTSSANSTTGLICPLDPPLSAYDNEYVGNTVLPHFYPPDSEITLWLSETYTYDGTIGAAGYTIDAIKMVETFDPVNPYEHFWQWVTDETFRMATGDQFLVLIDTNTWTRTDGLGEREFHIGRSCSEFVDDAWVIHADLRYWRTNGCYRITTQGTPYPHDEPSNLIDEGLDFYDVDDVGMTADGIFVLKITMKNLDRVRFPSNWNSEPLMGPVFPGFCRYGAARIGTA